MAADEFGEFFDQGFHFAGAVELVAEEVEDDEGVDFEVGAGVEDGDPVFIGFKKEVVGRDFAAQVGGLEKGGGDAPGDVVAVRVDDDLFARFSENFGEDVVGGGCQRYDRRAAKRSW